MVEEEEFFSVFARGRQIMFQENVKKVGEEEDRISVLPDCLLLEILSRLPNTKEAIRTGTLSKRWEHLWTWLPTLKFQHSNDDDDDNHSQSEFVSTVDKTLTQCRQLKLKKFQLMFTSYDINQYESQVNNWIRYALSCKVEELHLMLWNDEFSPDLRVNQSLFICTCFSHLRVSGCEFNQVGAISWKNLRSLCISHVRQLNEEMIENILSGSPILETLVLEYCHGYRRLDITSKSLKNLVFSGYIFLLVPLFIVESGIIEINAPNILSLTIKDDMELWKPLLVDVSSLVEANLDYTKLGYPEEEEEEENLKGCILNLRHVKELTIGANCSMVASGLEAKGFVFPSNVKFVKSNWFGSHSVESKD